MPCSVSLLKEFVVSQGEKIVHDQIVHPCDLFTDLFGPVGHDTFRDLFGPFGHDTFRSKC